MTWGAWVTLSPPLSTIPVLGLFCGFIHYLDEVSQHVAEFGVLFLYKPGRLCDSVASLWW